MRGRMLGPYGQRSRSSCRWKNEWLLPSEASRTLLAKSNTPRTSSSIDTGTAERREVFRQWTPSVRLIRGAFPPALHLLSDRKGFHSLVNPILCRLSHLQRRKMFRVLFSPSGADRRPRISPVVHPLPVATGAAGGRLFRNMLRIAIAYGLRRRHRSTRVQATEKPTGAPTTFGTPSSADPRAGHETRGPHRHRTSEDGRSHRHRAT